MHCTNPTRKRDTRSCLRLRLLKPVILLRNAPQQQRKFTNRRTANCLVLSAGKNFAASLPLFEVAIFDIWRDQVGRSKAVYHNPTRQRGICCHASESQKTQSLTNVSGCDRGKDGTSKHRLCLAAKYCSASRTYFNRPTSSTVNARSKTAISSRRPSQLSTLSLRPPKKNWLTFRGDEEMPERWISGSGLPLR